MDSNISQPHSSVGFVSCAGKKAITDLPLARSLFLLAYLCLFVVGVAGNFLVVWVVVTCKSMQTVTNVFIANLAVSDLIVCSTSIWLTPVYTYIGHWIWGGWMCYALPIFQGSSIFISSLTLTAIALDRHWVICLAQPRKHASTSTQVCVAVISLIWCVSVLLVLPYAVHMRIAAVKWPCNFSLCVEDWAGKEDMRSLYGVTTVFLQFFVPFAIIGRSYRRIWRFLEARRLLRKSDSDEQLARKRRLLSMLVRMVLLFGVCWLPFNLLNLLRDLGFDSFLKPYFSFLFLLAHLLSMFVPAANPLLYAWMNSSFRDAFLRVLPLRRWRKKIRTSGTTGRTTGGGGNGTELGMANGNCQQRLDELNQMGQKEEVGGGSDGTMPEGHRDRFRRASKRSSRSSQSLRLHPSSPHHPLRHARRESGRSRECEESC